MKNRLATALIIAVSLASAAYTLPLPQVPDTLRTPRERASFAALHFFDELAQAPADSMDTEAWQQTVANFLSLYPHIGNDSVVALASGRLVDAGRGNATRAADISAALETCLFDAASPQRDERLYARFLRLMADADYPDAERSRWLLEMVEKNLPGSKAPDFTFTDRQGRKRTLAASLGKPTILFFYDPGCDDCHRTAAEMAGDIILQSRIARGAAQVIAVTTADPDSWKEAAGQFPDTWTDGLNDGSIDSDDLFLIPTFPTIYLLDADGTIILKDAILSQALSTLMAM